MEDQEEDYHLPLLDQRVFGAGITRKRIQFIPSQTEEEGTTQTASGPSVGDKYLSIVLASAKAPPGQSNPSGLTSHDTTTLLCEICHLPMPDSDPQPGAKPHESSLAHQSCLPHSYPPSHLPRQHVGLRYLESYGWDPNARVGLGAEGQGIRVPIKGKMKRNTVGLGVRVKKGETERSMPPQKLDAKKVRKMEMENKRKAEKLREKFYCSEDVEKYLGGG